MIFLNCLFLKKNNNKFSQINSSSKDLLFEIFDDGDEILEFNGNETKLKHPRDVFRETIIDKPPRLLGTAIIGVDELRQNNNTISPAINRLNLHSQPFNSDNKIIQGQQITGIIVFEVFLRNFIKI